MKKEVARGRERPKKERMKGKVKKEGMGGM